MWCEYLYNNIFLKKLYDEVPELIGVEIRSIHAIASGTCIQIGTNLPRFADHPPKKWCSSYNTVFITLQFSNVQDLAWKGWETLNIGNIEIKKEQDGRYFVEVKTDKIEVSFRAEFISAHDITAMLIKPDSYP